MVQHTVYGCDGHGGRTSARDGDRMQHDTIGCCAEGCGSGTEGTGGGACDGRAGHVGGRERVCDDGVGRDDLGVCER